MWSVTSIQPVPGPGGWTFTVNLTGPGGQTATATLSAAQLIDPAAFQVAVLGQLGFIPSVSVERNNFAWYVGQLLQH